MRIRIMLAALVGISGLARGQGKSDPWPADVPGFVPPVAGEHPRLFFRKADLPKLRQKARTPEGQQILARLRPVLDGADGDRLPAVVVRPEHVPALLWVYRHFVEPAEQNGFLETDGRVVPPAKPLLKPGEKTFDVVTYPHRAVMALVNWPIGVEPVNPAQVLPKVHRDTHRGYSCCRRTWKDENDIIVSIHTSLQQPIVIWGLGMRFTWGKLPGATIPYYGRRIWQWV